MIQLWRKDSLQGAAAFYGTQQGLFPLGQIKPPNETPTDNQEDRTTWIWNPFPGWLPGEVPVAAPGDTTAIVTLFGNRIAPGTTNLAVNWWPDA